MDIRGFLAELKGRGVYRVAAFYAAGSWALLQVADVFFPILGFPDWAITTVLAVAALGFPVALMLAWVFEITAEGIVEIDQEVNFGRLRLSPARLVELGLLLALVFLVGYLYLDRLTLQEQVASAEGSADTRPSVAVMAFENMSDDPSAEYFGDGVAEEILNLLSRLNELNVAARTSSFYYKGKDVDLREVGEKLGVGHILEGSVRRSGDRVRVTAQLIEMDTGYHVWSETFDRDYSDSFRIQDEIARQVVGSMHVILSESSQEILDDRPTLDPAAYDFYLRGREYLRESLSQEKLESGIALFERAVELDQDYADAHAGLCDGHLELYRLELDPAHFDAAKSACETALSLSPDAPSVYVALGNLYQASGRYDEAFVQFENALAINPNSVDALIGLGRTYHLDNKPALAEETYARAIQIQPNYWRAYNNMGGFLYLSGRFEEAVPYFSRITELMPDNAQAFNGLAAAHYLLGHYEEAAEALKRSLELEPTALAYANTASMLFFVQRYREAVDLYHKAVELAPEDFQNWGALGDAYQYVGGDMSELAAPMYQNAIKLARERLRVNPQDATTLALLAHYQARIDDREGALQSMARARALAPNDMYVHYNCALALTTLGDEAEAVKSLEAAIDNGYSPGLVELDAGFNSLGESSEFRLLLDRSVPVPETSEVSRQ